MTLIDHLPQDCFHKIFFWCSLDSLHSCSAISKTWNQTVISSLHQNQETLDKCLHWLMYQAPEESFKKYAALIPPYAKLSYPLHLSPTTPLPKLELIKKAYPTLFEKITLNCQREEKVSSKLIEYMKNTSEVLYRGENFDSQLLTPQLKKLSIQQANWELDGIVIPHLARLSLTQAHVTCNTRVNITSIECLKLKKTKISSGQLLSDIISKTTKHLTLDGQNRMASDLPLAPSLETIKSSSISQNSLGMFLSQNPTLKSLSLYGNSHIPASFFKNSRFPPHLKKVDLTNTNIDSSGLFSLFSSCPHLEKVAIRSITKGIPTVIDVRSYLTQLKILHADICLFPSNSNYNFEEMFPNLEELILFSLKRNQTINHITLPKKLKKLKIESEILLPPEALTRLFKQCPELEELEFCPHNPTFEELIPPTSLQKVSIQSSQATPFSSLLTFLKKIPNISTVELSGTFIFDKNSSLTWPSTIKYATFNGSSYSKEALMSLFNASDNLKELVLTCVCKEVLELKFPKTLEVLKVHPLEESLSETHIEAIFQHCRRLKEVKVLGKMSLETLAKSHFPPTLQRLTLSARSQKEKEERFITAVREKIPTTAIEFVSIS